MKTPDVVTAVSGLRARVEDWRREGLRVALVPTMGALHEGHLSLVAAARKRAARTVVSIFVNPAQFAPHEDFDRYPRDLGRDCAYLAAQGLSDLVFSPEHDELYPQGFATRIEMAGPAVGLETDFRPHFFAGVATVVAKLLIAARPHVAMLGEKDYQQLLVVRRLARDLGLDVEIAGAPIVREPSGLALSSRNDYLGPLDRPVAERLNVVLAELVQSLREGESIAEVEQFGREALRLAGFDQVDYVTVRDAATLAKAEKPVAPMRVLAAARIGVVRLIDNMAV
ncbi:MAG TPA: pantoate--beta-alanine ligase [Rhizomicrobium sp.]|jgi:pantoate--beta-alanine ligase